MKNIPQVRWLLWRKDPHCHWCGIITTLPAKEFGSYPQYPAGCNLPPEAATLDHLYDRDDPRRGVGEYHNVLACHQCNHDRARMNRFMHGAISRLYWLEKRKEFS